MLALCSHARRCCTSVISAVVLASLTLPKPRPLLSLSPSPSRGIPDSPRANELPSFLRLPPTLHHNSISTPKSKQFSHSTLDVNAPHTQRLPSFLRLSSCPLVTLYHNSRGFLLQGLVSGYIGPYVDAGQHRLCCCACFPLLLCCKSLSLVHAI